MKTINNNLKMYYINIFNIVKLINIIKILNIVL